MIVKNPFQPPPELVEEEAMVNEEKINAELEPNELRIKFTGSDTLASCGGSRIEYFIEYASGLQIEGKFPCHKAEDTYSHFFETDDNNNLAKIMHGLKEKQIIFNIV